MYQNNNLFVILFAWISVTEKFGKFPPNGINLIVSQINPHTGAHIRTHFIESKMIISKMFLTQNILRAEVQGTIIHRMTFVEWRWQNGPNVTAFYCFIQCVKLGDRT